MRAFMLYIQFSYLLGVSGIYNAQLLGLHYQRDVLPVLNNNTLTLINDILKAVFIGLPGKSL